MATVVRWRSSSARKPTRRHPSVAKSLGILTRGQVVERARSLLAGRWRPTVYLLGAGGRDPRSPHPGLRREGAPKCDCSGMAAWAVGVDRYLPNGLIPHLPHGEWFETSNLFSDARSTGGYVDEVPWITAQPGDLLVWPDNRARKRQGHVGIVAEVDPMRGPVKVVHCSSGNARVLGNAIAETGVDLFVRFGAIVARVRWVQ